MCSSDGFRATLPPASPCPTAAPSACEPPSAKWRRSPADCRCDPSPSATGPPTPAAMRAKAATRTATRPPATAPPGPPADTGRPPWSSRFPTADLPDRRAVLPGSTPRDRMRTSSPPGRGAPGPWNRNTRHRCNSAPGPTAFPPRPGNPGWGTSAAPTPRSATRTRFPRKRSARGRRPAPPDTSPRSRRDPACKPSAADPATGRSAAHRHPSPVRSTAR